MMTAWELWRGELQRTMNESLVRPFVEEEV
jgi:hypothetical protein